MLPGRSAPTAAAAWLLVRDVYRHYTRTAMIGARRLSTVTWDCIHFGSVDGVGTLHADEIGIAVRWLDGSTIDSKDALLSQLASAFQFPSYFGHNWDAAEECLRDLGWLPANGYVLIISAALGLWHSSPEATGTLIEVWLSAAAWWSELNKPFHLVFSW